MTMQVFPVSVRVPSGPYELRNGRGRPCSPNRLWYRDDFAAPRQGGRYRHEATDVFAPEGSLVLAPEAGEVIGARETPRGGLLVELLAVDARGRGRRYLFSHLSALSVEVGDVVEAGEELGLVGRTGASTGPHLHFELRKDGKAIDPAPYFGLQSNHLTVNGRFNKATRIAWQQELKRRNCYEGVIDGIIGPMTIRGIQRWYNYGKIRYGTGYSVDYIYVDGILGPITRKAVQRKLNADPIDGIWGRITISRLQTYLNEVA